MEDREFKPGEVLNMLEWFADNEYLVDIHILAHGKNEAFCGYGDSCDFRSDPYDDNDFFEQLSRMLVDGDQDARIDDM